MSSLNDLFECHIDCRIDYFYTCYSGINADEVARLKSGGECDGFRVPAAISSGCLTTVAKPHRAWIPMLRFHSPA